jgi:single-strand DNA-binding protein
MTVNKAILIGNLGADPETRTATSGTMVANLRLATTERVKKGDAWEEATEWHRVTCFGRTAENVARYCKKGKQLYVEGRIQTRKYQDKDGNDRYATEIIANEVRFLGAGSGEGRGRGDAGGGGDGGSGGFVGGGPSGAGVDDDIPFAP